MKCQLNCLWGFPLNSKLVEGNDWGKKKILQHKQTRGGGAKVPQSSVIAKPSARWNCPAILSPFHTRGRYYKTYFVLSPGLVWKRIGAVALAQQCRAAERHNRKQWGLYNFVTASLETQSLTVATQIPETDTGTLKVNVNSFNEIPCLRRRTDTDGQMEMLSNSCLSSLESESRIWPPLHRRTEQDSMFWKAPRNA